MPIRTTILFQARPIAENCPGITEYWAGTEAKLLATIVPYSEWKSAAKAAGMPPNQLQEHLREEWEEWASITREYFLEHPEQVVGVARAVGFREWPRLDLWLLEALQGLYESFSPERESKLRSSLASLVQIEGGTEMLVEGLLSQAKLIEICREELRILRGR